MNGVVYAGAAGMNYGGMGVGGDAGDGPQALTGGANGVAGGVGWVDPTTAPDCKVSPLSYQTYSTEAELEALLVRRWRRCIAPQIAGEDVGVEFTADGHYYPLTFDASHEVVRQVGIDYGGTWTYYPVGSTLPHTSQPSTRPTISLDGGYTDAPKFTNDPRQMRMLFSPVPGIYVPLEP
jgi:hypothetical protein